MTPEHFNNFDDWMAYVNDIFKCRFGTTSKEAFDYQWSKDEWMLTYQRGYTPHDAVAEFIEEAKENMENRDER